MTVSTTNRKNSFQTNGVTVDFPFTFAVTNIDQVLAITVDASGNETPYTNFTVVLNSTTAGGTLTTGDILNNVELLVYRATPLTQNTDYINGGRFPADSHEEALDKLTLQNQDQQEELDRTLKSAISLDNPPQLGPTEEGKLLTVTNGFITSSDVTEQVLIDAADNANEAAENANNAAANAYGVDVGNYEDDVTLNTFVDYAVYERGTMPTLWKAKATTPLPYTLNSAVLPPNDPNIEAFIAYSPESLQQQIDQNVLDINQNADDIENQIAPNRISVSQMVVEGTTGQPLPENGTLTSYAIGNEMALGWVVTEAVVDATKDANGNTDGASGKVRYTINKDEKGLIGVAQLFGSVMQSDGTNLTQVYADGSGITLGEDATTVWLEIDFSQSTGFFYVAGISEQRGRLEALSTEEVTEINRGKIEYAREWVDVSATRTVGVLVVNDSQTDWQLSIQQNSLGGLDELYIDGQLICEFSSTGLNGNVVNPIVKRGSNYLLTGSGTPSVWNEFKVQ